MPAMHLGLVAAAALLVGSGGGARAQTTARATGDVAIVGRVLGQNGEPVLAAHVWATAPGSPDVVVRRTRTDGEGTFLLSRLASAAIVLHARAPGMTTASLDASTLGSGGTIAVDLRLWEARTLRGRLLDDRGMPIAGASLVATKDFAPVPLTPVLGTTDAAGNFELPGVPIGDCVLRASAPGFVCQGHAFFDWIDERADLRLERGDGVQLRITTEGLPAETTAAARVSLQLGGGGVMPDAIAQQRLDEEGACTVKGLPVAEWSVSIRHPDYRFAPSGLRVLREAAPDPLRFFAIPIVSTAISGQVLVQDRPLVWQSILLHLGPSVTSLPLQAVIDDDGWFEFTPVLQVGDRFVLELPGGDLVFTQDKSRGARGSHDLGYLGKHEGVVQAGAMQLTAMRATRLRGRVVDALGKAVPLVAVELQQQVQTHAVLQAAFQPTTSWRTFARTTSGADGSYRIGGLQPSDFAVRLRVAGSGAIGATGPFRIDENPADQDVRTEPPGRVEGVLTDEAGEPLIGTGVVLEGEPRTVVLTDYRGAFVFVGVAPGTHQLAVRRANATAPASDEFELKSGEVARIDLR